MPKVTELVSDKARIQSFYSFNKYLLSNYYVPGTVADAGNPAVNKTEFLLRENICSRSGDI